MAARIVGRWLVSASAALATSIGGGAATGGGVSGKDWGGDGGKGRKCQGSFLGANLVNKSLLHTNSS